MKTSELYLKILENVRSNVLNINRDLSDFENIDKVYDLLSQVNSVCNILSSLIDVMSYEK